MSEPAVPLFVDTGALFAYFYRRTNRHTQARSIFGAIRAGELRYGPLYTSRYVLSELATLTLRKAGHANALTAVTEIRNSPSFNLLPVGEPVFSDAIEQFGRYDDQQISFVDHISAVLARRHGIDHVFAYDSDFATLGFTRVPVDTGEG